RPNQWWSIVQRSFLGPVMRALAEGDIESLRIMYRNFFRDPCGAGLIRLPPSMNGAFSGRPLTERDKQFILIDTIHQQDAWKQRTEGRFLPVDLRVPGIGNPFGVVIDGVFLRPGAEGQHFYAQQTIGLLAGSEAAVIAEIGGGFGGMAYYLLRDCPNAT